VDEGREDKMLSDLFRQKLENAEVIPSPSVGANLMRTVGRREFLRFNPARINIWYVGAVAAAGTALAFILSSSPDLKTEEIQAPAQIEISTGSVLKGTENSLSTALNNVEKKTQTASNERKPEVKNGSEIIVNEKTRSNQSEIREVESTEDRKVNPVPDKDVLAMALPENNKLRGNLRKDSYISASATDGCSPLKISFRCLAVPYDSCTWYFGDGGYSSLRDPIWLFDNAGEYKVTLNVFSSGIKSVSSVIITIHPKPEAKFEISPENAVLPNDEITFRNYSDGAESYKWDFGDGATSELYEPHHSYRKFGNYNVRLIAISEFGCSDSLVIYNTFSTSGNYIEFPNAFIPNANGPSGGYFTPKSDEGSQIFHPVFSGVTSYQLRIFSKMGMLIFESNDVNYGWDGYYKGQLCDPGVYIWKVRGNFMSGEQFTRMGDVTLLKN
jgi:PKD repeat protein